MFNYNINWVKIIKEYLPLLLRTSRRIDWIKAFIAPFNQMHQEFLVQYQVYIYKIRYTGQVIYLEKILNKKFSPITGGIYITNALPITRQYLYMAAELKPPRYLYNLWSATTSYAIGHYCAHGNKIWKALAANTNSQPSPLNSDWVFHKNIEFVRMASEFAMQYNFIVMVPAAITFDAIAMKGLIDYYRLAGKPYKIQIY